MVDLENAVFGRLTVLRRVDGGKWMCQCSCGKICYPLTSNLRKGNSKSCGCALTEARVTHGQSGSAEHKVWRGMRSRCRVESDGAWRNYGGRGITVCAEWDDFTVFLRDMGLRPSPAHDLDRIDNNAGYSKANCRWILHRGNVNNKRSNRVIEFRGESKTIAEWARALGMNYRTLNNRINRGWSPERALSEPI